MKELNGNVLRLGEVGRCSREVGVAQLCAGEAGQLTFCATAPAPRQLPPFLPAPRTHLRRTLPQRVPLQPPHEPAHKLLVELCLDHLDRFDVLEGERKVAGVAACLDRAGEEVLGDKSNHRFVQRGVEEDNQSAVDFG